MGAQPVEIMTKADLDRAVIELARRHAERPDLSRGAARTLILGLAAKLEKTLEARA